MVTFLKVRLGGTSIRGFFPYFGLKAEVSLSEQSDYGLWVLATHSEVEGISVSSEICSAALAEWKNRFPNGTGARNNMWAKEMDKLAFAS